MAKQALYYDDAKRLFVFEGFSLDAIVGLLDNHVSRKTLYNWKTAGNWEDKRKKHLNKAKDLQTDLVELAELTLKEAKANPTSQNINAMSRALAALKTYQGVKLLDKETTPEDRKGLTPEAIKQIEKEVLGLE